MTSITHLVGAYRSSTHRLEYESGHPGMVTFDAGDGMLVCANERGDDGVELFASPGYMPADELASLRAHSKDSKADNEEDEQDEDILKSWRSDGAHWSVDVAPSGLVTLACVRLHAPCDLVGFKEAVETYQREYRTWETRLRAIRESEAVPPPTDEEELVRAMHLRV